MNNLRSEILKNHDGLFWPADDIGTYLYLKHEVGIIAWAVKHVPEPKVLVQAGGNCGYYVERYARIFDQVHTFEPDALNFRCLVLNVPYDNVSFYRAALGAEAREVGMKVNRVSRGATGVDLVGSGVRMVTLDSLNLPRVDLIHLDIEGSELMALRGAAMTIGQCRPVVVLEINGRCRDFGYTEEQISSCMHGFGYLSGGRMHDEFLFLPLG